MYSFFNLIDSCYSFIF